MNKKNNIILLLLVIILALTFFLIKESTSNKFLRDENIKLREDNDQIRKDFQNFMEDFNKDKSDTSNPNRTSDNNGYSERNQEKSINIVDKKILFFNQGDLKSMTKEEVVFDNVDRVQLKLSEANTWLNQGFSQEDSEVIANRFSTSSDQARGILKGVAKQNKSLKLVLIPTNGGLKVNIGSTSPNYK